MLGRSMFSHHLWQENRVFSRAEAWLDLLQTAAIVPQKRLIAGHPIEIPRGGIVASVRFLSVRYKWSNTKVCLFLDSLECEGMIIREKRHGNTAILLCNFEKYNTGKRQIGDGEATARRRRGDEIEEGKDRKNGNTSSSAIASGFEAFWAQVPQQVGTGAARKAWEKAVKKTPIETILSGLPSFIAYESKRAQQQEYRPLHPSTWLNQERWKDQHNTENQSDWEKEWE